MKIFEIIFLVSEIIAVLCFCFFTEYGENIHPKATTAAGEIEAENTVQRYYPFFQDVHVMIFIGFGFLMVFLKSHSWTSVGFNFLIAAWCLQITILFAGFWHQAIVKEGHFHLIELDLTSLIIGDFGAAAVLITFGAILGKCTLPQLFLIGTIEIIFFTLNETIGAGLLGAVDMGGSMYVHTFGAFFGVAASFFFEPKKALADKNGNCGGGYNSQLIAMVGTLFLWMYWPSFNGALAFASAQHRVVLNTVFAIAGSCVSACIMSRLIEGKLDMEVVLNATLAGGVAIGTSSDLVVNAGIAIMIGAIAGIISALGFLKINAALQKSIKLHDTCGVLFLHGIPGALGGIIGAICSGAAETSHGVAAAGTFAEMEEGRTLTEQGWI